MPAFVRYSLSCLALVILMGCGPSGPKTYQISGTVMLGDKPLPEGQISFMDEAGKLPPAGAPIKDGKYTVAVQPGKKKVEVTATRESGPIDSAMGQAPRKQYINEKFNVNTTLTVTVEAKDATLPPFVVSE